MLLKYFVILGFFLLSLQAQYSLEYVDNELKKKRKYSHFDIFQNQITYKNIKSRLLYVKKSSQLENYFTLSEKSLKIYASAKDKKNDNYEYELLLAKQNKDITVKKKLSEMTIVIDPGHVGGDKYSYLESRYIQMAPETVGGRNDVSFNEGNSAFLTAMHLKKLLEEKGTKVILTREKMATVPKFSKDFFLWLQQDFYHELESYVSKIKDPAKRMQQRTWWLTRADMMSIFRRIYNPIDLKLRALNINVHKPDLTIIIHFNVGAGNNEYGQNLGCNENYNMAFVAGSFLSGELSTKVARYEFLRQLVSDDINRSMDLSNEVVQQFNKKLNVPILQDPKKADYLKKYCLPTKFPGVYARNLTLTKLVHGPICYGESLYQDNIEECLLLAKKDDEIAGIKTSHRLKKVAKAYFEGIVNYCKK